jgi:hypothetical protein
MAVSQDLKAAFPLKIGDWTFPGYTAFYTLILNLVVAAVLTLCSTRCAPRGRSAMPRCRPTIARERALRLMRAALSGEPGAAPAPTVPAEAAKPLGE